MFYIQIFSLCFTLLAIYVCLKWNKFAFVQKEQSTITDDEALRRFNIKHTLIRLGIIVVGLLIDALAYFVAEYSGGMYLALMLLLCLPFVIRNASPRS